MMSCTVGDLVLVRSVLPASYGIVVAIERAPFLNTVYEVFVNGKIHRTDAHNVREGK